MTQDTCHEFQDLEAAGYPALPVGKYQARWKYLRRSHPDNDFLIWQGQHVIIKVLIDKRLHRYVTHTAGDGHCFPRKQT